MEPGFGTIKSNHPMKISVDMGMGLCIVKPNSPCEESSEWPGAPCVRQGVHVPQASEGEKN